MNANSPARITQRFRVKVDWPPACPRFVFSDLLQTAINRGNLFPSLFDLISYINGIQTFHILKKLICNVCMYVRMYVCTRE
jgi:hypothetical protein